MADCSSSAMQQLLIKLVRHLNDCYKTIFVSVFVWNPTRALKVQTTQSFLNSLMAENPSATLCVLQHSTRPQSWWTSMIELWRIRIRIRLHSKIRVKKLQTLCHISATFCSFIIILIVHRLVIGGVMPLTCPPVRQHMFLHSAMRAVHRFKVTVCCKL